MNRLAFMAAMKERASAALGGAMMLVDLDVFKCFNDSNGHQVGDLLLRSLADRMQGWASPDALLARGGGDEFLIHLPRISLCDAQAESEALMKLVRAPLKANGQSHVITCSVGLSACHDLEPDEILRRADIALYAAKHRGRNQVVAYGDGVSNIPAARRELAAIVMDLQRQLAAVRDEARTDALTGLANRRALNEAMEAFDAGSHAPMGIVFIDLDHFGAINKLHGDAVGDRVLQQVAAVLQSSVRHDDLVFRKGGEEFVVLMPDVSGAEAVQAAGRLRQAIRTLRINDHGDAGDRAVTATLGVCIAPTTVACTAALAHASAAAMKAKVDGARDAVHECAALQPSDSRMVLELNTPMP